MTSWKRFYDWLFLLQQSLCSEMIQELRFAVRCHGSSKKSKSKRSCAKCKKGHSASCPLTVDMPKDSSSSNGILPLRELRKSPVSRGREFAFGEGSYMHVEYSDTETWQKLPVVTKRRIPTVCLTPLVPFLRYMTYILLWHHNPLFYRLFCLVLFMFCWIRVTVCDIIPLLQWRVTSLWFSFDPYILYRRIMLFTSLNNVLRQHVMRIDLYSFQLSAKWEFMVDYFMESYCKQKYTNLHL